MTLSKSGFDFEVSRRVLLTLCNSQKSKPFYEGRRRREPGAATPRANSILGLALTQPLLLIASFPLITSLYLMCRHHYFSPVISTILLVHGPSVFERKTEVAAQTYFRLQGETDENQ